MNTSFLDSKTMQLVLLGIVAVQAMIFVAVVVKVVFDTDVFQLVAAGIAGITAQTTGGTVRNIMVDGPQRIATTEARIAPPPYGPPAQ